MSRADSPLKDRLVIACGSRRSGTHLLQRILVSHPLISEVPGETYLFSDGIRPLFDRFQHGAKGSPQTGTVYADRDTVIDAARDLCDVVLGAFLEPGAERVSERTPAHVHHIELISDLYPDAWFVHIIRDGRDVARSLLSMDWGPQTIEDAAAEWRDAVAAGRSARRPARLHELRYEQLVRDPQAAIRGLFEFLELPAGAGALEPALAQARTHGNVDPGSAHVGIEKWREAFSGEDLARFERVAGGMLEELGYPRAAEGGRSGGTPLERPGSGGPLGVLRRRRARAAETHGRLADRRLQLAQHTGERFLSLLSAGRPGELRALLVDDVAVRVVEGGSARERRGAAALLEELSSDPALTARQRHGELHTAVPELSLLTEHALPDGSTARRLIYLLLDADSRVRAATIHRL